MGVDMLTVSDGRAGGPTAFVVRSLMWKLFAYGLLPQDGPVLTVDGKNVKPVDSICRLAHSSLPFRGVSILGCFLLEDAISLDCG